VSDDATQPQLRIPRNSRIIAGRYRLDNELGKGGTGVVYRALDLELDEPIAIKMFKRQLSPRDREQLRREVRLARKVTHRNVARIHDLGEHAGSWFTTMQLVEGTTLRHELERRGRLPRTEAYEVMAEICEGVAAAHEVGVLHLDLKPENVMRSPGAGVVVLDFGIARGIAEPVDKSTRSGTPAYMAPEQRAVWECDVRTDLYAIGIMLFEMLVGSLPGDDGAPAIDQIENAPDALIELLEHLLALSPAQRPASARVVLDALHRLLGVTMARTADLQRQASRTRIAVLPFRSGAEHATLARGITEELADRLMTLRETSVLTTTATTRFSDADPMAAARALGVDSIVEGVVHHASDAVQVTARLVDASRGEISWSERFEAPVGDVLSLQDRIARRIAEALRVELGTLPFRGVAARSAVELYLRARAKLVRLDLEGPFGAIADLTRACELAPELAPAIALRALACVRAWFFATDDPEGSRARALAAVENATTLAADYPETQLATGVLAFQSGEVADAVEHIERALDLAPSHPLALEYSGRLLCEAGHATEGFRRIELACELDPKLGAGLLDVARHFALHRAWPEYEATLERIVHRGFVNHGLRILQARAATWRHSKPDIARFASELALHDADRPVLVAYAGVLLGTVDLGELDAVIAEALSHPVSRRFASVIHQFATEVMSAGGEIHRAAHHLEQATTTGLIDLEWLDLCPSLGPLRSLASFPDVRRRVRARVASLWR